MPASLFDRLVAVVSAAAHDILHSANGFGHTDFEVAADGELVPRGTTITIQPESGEDFAVFVARLKATDQWRAGDAVQFVSNKRKLQLVRITRNPPKTELPA
jgi:hypothetical protein